MSAIAIEAANDNADEKPGPSLAIPPLYLLRVADYCPQCGELQHVYALGCGAFLDAEEGEMLDDFHFLSYVRALPAQVLAMLTAKCPCYFFDRTRPGEAPYLMNHCRCGARLDDDYLHGDVGAAFWPDTPSGYETIRLFRLPVGCNRASAAGFRRIATVFARDPA